MTSERNGHNGLHGAEVSPDGLDLALNLRDWLDAHPEDTSAWDAARNLGQPRQAGKLPIWKWSQMPNPPERRWLVQGWLPAGRVSLLAGPGGAGKSRLALQLAAGIASGGGKGDAWIDAPMDTLRLGDVPSDGAPVVYASWEDEPEEFSRRLRDISSNDYAPWVTPTRLDLLEVVNMARLGPIWAPVEGRHISTLAELTEVGHLLRQRCQETGSRLLILDPLAAAYAGDENARGLVRAFISDWDGWASAHDCTVLLVAHPPKAGNAGYSGSTDWEAAVRSRWTLEKKPHGQKLGKTDNRPLSWQLDLPKRNYGPEQAALVMELDDADGLRWRANWWDSPRDSGESGEY